MTRSNKQNGNDSPTVSTANDNANGTIEPPRVEINLLIKLIPEFDGSFDKLTSFIANVSEAYRLAKEDQRDVLMCFIRAALTGSAQGITQTQTFVDWNSLKLKLIETFGEKKSFAQIQFELQNTRQKPDESIASFTQRVESKTQKLMSTLSFETGAQLDSSQQDLIRKMGLTSFIHNCLPQYGQLLRIRNPTTITEASRLASDEEIALRYQKLSLRNFGQTNKKVYATNLLHCTFCKKNGHEYEKCFKRKRSKKPICYSCNEEGHTSNRCPQKKVSAGQVNRADSNSPKNGEGSVTRNTKFKNLEEASEVSALEILF